MQIEFGRLWLGFDVDSRIGNFMNRVGNRG